MLSHFPREVTKENYRDLIEEYFIEIGVTECFEESVMKMAKKPNKPYRRKFFACQNITKRTEDHPHDLKQEYIERNPLEFEVYNYVRSRYGAGIESVRHVDILKSNIETAVKNYACKGRKLIVRARK